MHILRFITLPLIVTTFHPGVFAAEVGQGLVTVMQQLAREVLQIEQVAVVWTDTGAIGSAGSTSASRQRRRSATRGPPARRST